MTFVAVWLRVQGLLLAAGVVAFGAVFPLIGLAFWALGVDPPDASPAEVAFVLGLAGPITAAVYLPGTVLSLFAARKVRTDPASALPWVLAAAVTAGFVCVLAVVPLVLFLVVPRSKPETA